MSHPFTQALAARDVDALIATEASRFVDALSSHRAADHAARLRQLAERLRGGVAR